MPTVYVASYIVTLYLYCGYIHVISMKNLSGDTYIGSSKGKLQQRQLFFLEQQTQLAIHPWQKNLSKRSETSSIPKPSNNPLPFFPFLLWHHTRDPSFLHAPSKRNVQLRKEFALPNLHHLIIYNIWPYLCLLVLKIQQFRPKLASIIISW